MTLLELMATLRSRLGDTGDDTDITIPPGYVYGWEVDSHGLKWSNDQLIECLNAACEELALRVPIRDFAQSSATHIAIVSGQARYALNPRILMLDDVLLASTDAPLQKFSDADVRNGRLGEAEQPPPCGVIGYRGDLDQGYITLYPTPTASDTLLLWARRTPLAPWDWAQRQTQTSEFPESLDRALLDWACKEAFSIDDSEVYNMEMAGYFQGQFSQRVGPRVNLRVRQVLNEVAGKRLRTTPTYY